MDDKKPTKGPTTASVGENTEPISEARKRSLANLRPPWKPGDCPNPGGRPKKKPITEALELLIEKAPQGKRKSYAILLAEAILKRGLSGDVSAFKEVSDRLEGKSGTPAPDDVERKDRLNELEDVFRKGPVKTEGE